MRIKLIILILLLFTLSVNAQTTSTAQDTTVYTKVDKNAEFPGGMNGLYQYLGINLVYPETARKANLQGRVFVSFTVEKEGNLSNLKIFSGLSPEIDAEAIRVLSAAPNWLPGQKNGMAVRSRYTLPLNFTLKDTVKTVFAPSDLAPTFPGGTIEFNRYLAASLNYPLKAKEDNLTGKVYVTFMVEKDGTLTDFKILKPLSPETDAEAIRLMKNSKNWTPAQHNGLPVRQQYTVQINFQLDDRE